MITAPFNFVPLSEKVFFPDWADSVSHDIPFEDTQSGSIDISITAKSPIFIRNHSSDRANPSTEFCNHNGEYYIPSSSVKGMIRNVLEIMSFGKITIDKKVHTKTMSIRDMTNSRELVGTAKGCGFLKQNENGDWFIENYGKPRTIAYKSKYDKTINNSTIKCDFETAEEKYNKNSLYQRISVEGSLKDLEKNGKKIGTKRVAEIVNGQDNAYLILTGGIEGKKNEFVFMDTDRGENILLNEDVVNKFKQVYFESESIDGNFWKNNWDRDIGIPIFYITDRNQNVTDIGLSQLFKLAYNYTIDDATKQNLETIKRDENEFIKLDLAQTIFGIVDKSLDEKDSYALKGRVQFSHFKADSKVDEYEEIYTVLGTPRASFYPEYIEQNCKDGKVENDKYNTLMDKSSKISGWKRYPLRFGKPKYKKAEEGTDSATRFTPLGNYKGNDFNEFSFSGKVRFHNLKKVELGALLSALSFHGHQNNFYHNIGMAKSLGFGKIKIDVDLDKYQKYLIEYEMLMNKELNRSWIETEQIKELFTMAYKDLNIDDKLKYLNLDPDKKINKFVDAKNEKINREYVGRDCLPKCSKLFDLGEAYPKSMLTEEVLEKVKKEEKDKREKEIFNSKLQEVLLTDNTQIIQNFIDKYPNYQNIEEIKTKKETIERAKKDNRYQEVNKKFNSAYEALEKKKGNQKQYQKEKDKFVKKWSKAKENKGSEYILEHIAKLK